MKKLIIIIYITVFSVSCSSENENVISTNFTLKHIVTEKSSEESIVYTQEYIMDNDGKVVQEKFQSMLYPNQSSTSTFEYDNEGKVVKEVRNKKLVYSVVWNDNIATVKDLDANLTFTCIFQNGKLLQYSLTGNSYKFNYDQNDNVISQENNGEIFVEFLNYDTSVSNPMYLIKSIGILRMASNPYFKNFFQTKKAYPFEDIDFSVPLTYYTYQKMVGVDNRITKITNNENTYTSKFEYN
jgi:YD repeat-containing protein